MRCPELGIKMVLNPRFLARDDVLRRDMRRSRSPAIKIDSFWKVKSEIQFLTEKLTDL